MWDRQEVSLLPRASLVPLPGPHCCQSRLNLCAGAQEGPGQQLAGAHAISSCSHPGDLYRVLQGLQQGQ